MLLIALAAIIASCGGSSPSDTPNTYTVTFNANNGEANTTQKVTEGGKATVPSLAPTKANHDFDDWYTDDGVFTDKWDFAVDTVLGDTTLYANWVPEIAGMSWVPGGTFEMGTPEGSGRIDERPVHTVTISGFYMGKYEVTQTQYEAVMGTDPSSFTGANLPVEQVTWYDAVEFCNKLSEAEGLTLYYTIDKDTEDPDNSNSNDTVKWLVTRNESANGYRLPTEAEWEYAARGGNGSPNNYIYSGSNDIDDVAWYSVNSGRKTHEVGPLAANGLGLYDMSGNVCEWCWDWYKSDYDYPGASDPKPTGASSGSYRVGRDGGWGDSAWYVRSAHRSNGDPFGRSDYLGFRLVRG